MREQQHLQYAICNAPFAMQQGAMHRVQYNKAPAQSMTPRLCLLLLLLLDVCHVNVDAIGRILMLILLRHKVGERKIMYIQQN